MTKIPVKPKSANPHSTRLKRFLDFKKDMFRALPERLYGAWMAQVKTPFYNSYMVNDPNILNIIFSSPNARFPKADTIYQGMEDLLGQSVFVTNGELWEKQRRIINPSFQGGRLTKTLPAMQEATRSFINYIGAYANNEDYDIEYACSFFAADVIFRTLFSTPIDNARAIRIFSAFQIYQRQQPVLNVMNLLRVPDFIPRFKQAKKKNNAGIIRKELRSLVDERLQEIKNNNAPDDLATKILSTNDPITGDKFTAAEMVDQVGIFFLAGHETSASALGWALYLLAFHKDIQSELRDSLADIDPLTSDINTFNKNTLLKNIFAETLRLYPPVPMIARDITQEENFRDTKINKGDLCFLSTWHSARHNKLWDAPDEFRPSRWSEEMPQHCRDAYFPFSKGDRICIGAGFAQLEAWLALASLVKHFDFSLGSKEPIPVAHLTLRAQSQLLLRIRPIEKVTKDK